ncbi:Defensin-like protein [Trifolium repens]|nr:Defensin-like protein [Trifolium repens]
MANQISNYLFFIILVLVLYGQMKVEAGSCSEPMGACGPIGNCDQRCKAKYGSGQGSCKLGLCTCYYSCGQGPSPDPPERKCKSSLGICNSQCDNACCNSNCASRFNQGIGDCSNVGGSPYRACTCYYVGDCH